MRKLRRSVKKHCSKLRVNQVLVYKRFVYRCQECGHTEQMYLETGLEDHSRNHKPVPFAIKCPKCGRCHMIHSDWHLDKTFTPQWFYKEKISYFKNDPKSDCGIPIYVAKESEDK